MRQDHTPPYIDYTRRDYAGFRQLLLDQLTVLAPGWVERAEADLGIAVVDILAYVADYMSYYQDAVATEAYLGTARLRRSVRRHARLLDYHLHDGCNARAWVTLEVRGNLTLPRGTQLFAGGEGSLPPVVRAGASEHRELLSRGSAVVFETLHAVSCTPRHNTLAFARQGPDTLVAGATDTLLSARRTGLQPGDVLIFEEIVGPLSGLAADADPAHRHAVRLTAVGPEPDGTRITWDDDDALPFDLVTHAAFGGQRPIRVSVARGNVVLADHGRTVEPEELPAIPEGVRYRPRLRQAGLTFAEPYDHPQARDHPAAAALVQRPESALPAISLVELSPEPLEFPAERRNGSARGDTLVPTVEHPAGSGHFYAAKPWTLRAALLSSGIFLREYRVEMEEGGVAYLRFGFAEAGWQPATVGSGMLATYRVGGGPGGNLGQDAVASIAVAEPERVMRARNPLAARGGTTPQGVAAARLHAPHAYRTWEPPEGEGAPEYAPQAFTAQERCVTPEDYAAVAARHPEVAQAVAQPAWTGSARQVVVYVSRHDGETVSRAFCTELREFLEPYSTAGTTLAVAPPRYVPLAVRVCVQLRPGQVHTLARQTLLQALVGPEGFFRPSAFGFGQPVHRSRLVAHLATLPGVAWVEVPGFRRAGAERDADQIVIGPLEIAHVDPEIFQHPDALRVEGGR